MVWCGVVCWLAFFFPPSLGTKIIFLSATTQQGESVTIPVH